MQALLLYEEAIPDTAQQRVALAAMTGALQRARLPAESRAALVAKATAYAARLLRRADQCRAVLVCSHMHWQVSALVFGSGFMGKRSGWAGSDIAAPRSWWLQRSQMLLVACFVT